MPAPKADEAPFPYFGGKSSVASDVWERFGEVRQYIEPFAGTIAVWLKRPFDVPYAILNDKYGLLVNFWRSVKQSPEKTAKHAKWIKSEADMHARRRWLLSEKERIRESVRNDPTWHEPKAAGWWVYEISCSISGKSCKAGRVGDRPDIWNQGVMSKNRRDRLRQVFGDLSSHLQGVDIWQGDWKRTVGSESALFARGKPTAVFLDPPYTKDADRYEGLYHHDGGDVGKDVAKWCRENGDDDRLRIALCGYEREYDMPDSWDCMKWTAQGGMHHVTEKENDNNTRERIWFSPHCKGERQTSLLEVAE